MFAYINEKLNDQVDGPIFAMFLALMSILVIMSGILYFHGIDGIVPWETHKGVVIKGHWVKQGDKEIFVIGEQ